MPAYDRSPSTTCRPIDEFERGVGWLAHPDETGRRASHAFATVDDGDDDVWVVDPLDAPGVDDLLADLGEVAGVAVLSSYHVRDADTLASRHDVPVHVPRWLDGVADRIDAPVERDDTRLGDTGFAVTRLDPLPSWREAVAYRPADGTLVVPDLLGTGPGYTVGDERIGVALSHRLLPPRDAFGEFEPERVLFGHGEGVLTDASAALADGLAGARRRLPRALLTELGTNLRLLVDAL